MLSSGLYAVFGQVPFPAVVTVLDVVLVFLLLAGAMWTVIETRRVRDGWMGKSKIFMRSGPKRTHEEFVARYRRLLGMWGWSLVVIGGVSLALRMLVVLSGEQVSVLIWLGVVAFLIWGVVFLGCRRMLDSAPQSPARGPGQEAASS